MDTETQTFPRLVVESGLHRTASSPIPIGETRVGAALDTDIGVGDLSVAVAFVIRRTADTLFLRAADADLDVGGKTLRPGRERALGRTTTFTSGGVRFRLDVPAARLSRGAPAVSRLRSTVRFFVGGAVGIAVLTLALSLHSAPFPDLAGLRLVRTDTIGANPPVSSPVPTPPKPEPSSTALLDGLHGQVSTARIETVDFRLQPDGAIAAIGTIAPAQEAAWHEIGRWFDTEAHGRFILVDDVKVADPAPVLQIQAVWPGRNPYVVDGSGQKLFVGSTLSSGWVIRGIDKSRVLIERDEQIVAVRF